MIDSYVTFERNISSDPITGLDRRARLTALKWMPTDEVVTLDISVYYVDSGEFVSALRLKPYNVSLVAHNGTLVDPSTGMRAELTPDEPILDEEGEPVLDENGFPTFVPAHYPEDAIGEYDFYWNLAQAPRVIVDLVAAAIDLADASGRFNV